MNNRYFIRIGMWGYRGSPSITTMDWYDNPDELIWHMKMQFERTVFELSDKRGKYMRKLKRKGVDWFKKKVDDKTFDYSIEVIRFNHSFDNHKEFKEWLECSNIINMEDQWNVLPGDIENKKALQEYATDYYVDIYDYNFNKIDSLSLIHGETLGHRRTGKILNFNIGDKISYLPHGNDVYTVLAIPDAYHSLYWHDGYVTVHDEDNDIIIGEFDYPDDLYVIRQEDK